MAGQFFDDYVIHYSIDGVEQPPIEGRASSDGALSPGQALDAHLPAHPVVASHEARITALEQASQAPGESETAPDAAHSSAALVPDVTGANALPPRAELRQPNRPGQAFPPGSGAQASYDAMRRGARPGR
jgi:hypothetical protein